MIDRATWKRWLTHPVVDWTVFILGVILILLAPVVGALPGPGGVFVLALGLAMVLRTSRWARRRYVEFKKWQPKAGRWTDWGMRRKSALRREKLAKDQKVAEEDGLTDDLQLSETISSHASLDASKSDPKAAKEMDAPLRGGVSGN